jgi:soluble lytic murein transglycosylase
VRRPVRRASAIPLLLLLLAAGRAGAAQLATARLPAETEQRYAAAIEALRQGDAAPALREFASPDATRSVVGDYVRYLHAEALLRTGDLAGARRVAEAAAEEFGDRRVGRSALLLAAYAAARAGDEKGNDALLRRFLLAHAESPEMPIALYLLGESFEARGQRENAARTYRELVLLAPASEYADGAADRLRELARAGVVLPPPSAAERLDRAERLLRAGMAEEARGEAAAVAGEATGRDLAGRALAVVASALSRMRRYEAAAGAVQQALDRALEEAKPALRLKLGRLLYQAGKREQALAALAGIPASPEADAAAAAYLRAVVLEESGRHADAAAAYEQTAARFAERDVAASALWRLGWLRYLADDRGGAAEYWRRLAELPAGRRDRLAAIYWTGRALEEAGRAADGTVLYARVLVEAPRSYYGILAAARAGDQRPRETPPPRVELPADLAQALPDDVDRRRIETLARIGLPEYAAAEMEDVALRSLADPVKLYWLSTAYRQQERYDLSLRILRRYFSDAAASGHPALPRAFWEMAYPLAWQSELMEAASRSKLDPFFVAAIAREESSFDPLARSRAGARGLMQLMPETARRIAQHLGLAFRHGALLDDPDRNLRLGASHLADLLREFGDARLAAAAYNAGAVRVREWWSARRTSDMEAFVEQIPYEETREYVKKVMRSWEEYRRLYGSGPAR